MPAADWWGPGKTFCTKFFDFPQPTVGACECVWGLGQQLGHAEACQVLAMDNGQVVLRAFGRGVFPQIKGIRAGLGNYCG
jgi:hypothetical protein